MPSKFIGPDFEDFTITSGNLRWFHSCRWEDSQAESFANLRKEFPNSFGKDPNLFNSKSQFSPSVTARWLLIDDQDSPQGWAELQSFPSRLDRWGVLFGSGSNGGDFAELSLSKLISFCFLVGKFDHLKIANLSLKASSQLDDLAKAAGEIRKTYVLAPFAWHPSSQGFIAIHTLDLSRWEWANSPVSCHSNSDLNGIQMRIKRFEKAQQLSTPKQKRRGLLARLLRPKLDDPLF